ncbi:MAG: Acyl-CoA dehydrogenase type 2 protein [Dactylosporangium sp.]|nr:Acyl-CoA dehydrogenase type 2 protein [Dactylosporangium sp.]
MPPSIQYDAAYLATGSATPAQPIPPLRQPDLDRLPNLVAALARDAAGHDRDGSFPADGVAGAHTAGLLTLTVARRFGGPGGGLADTVHVLRELGRGDPSVALVTAMTLLTHAGQARSGSWPERIYREVLAEAASGPVLINALRVEPELGTPTRGGLPATTARRTADGWSLTGRKIYSTGAVALRWMLVWARTDEDPVRVGAFVVRADSPGITIEPTWDHLGLRASRSDDVRFDGTPVAADATVGLAVPGQSTMDPTLQIGWGSLAIAALYLGVAQAARDWLTGYLHQRIPTALGASLATLPRFQAAVGEIEAQIQGADELLTSLAARIDHDEPAALARAGVAKLLVTRAAISAVEQAVALVGNPGLTRTNPLQRHLRDVLCSRIHTPQDDAILSATGRSTLGLH